jgi:hypothetical protein
MGDEAEGKIAHTSHHTNLLRVFATNHENNVSLAGIDIVILEEEGLVNAILLESAELHKKADRPGERLLNDEILLASYLESRQLGGRTSLPPLDTCSPLPAATAAHAVLCR